MFLKFLNAKPNTLQSILNTEKDKTDRQKSEYGLVDLVRENLSTYNECFVVYTEFIQNSFLEFFDEVFQEFKWFNGFVMTVKGDFICGDLQENGKLKEVIVNQGKILKKTYKWETTVSFIKRI